MQRVTILVLDSFGIGATDDADRFGDVGANTFASIARHRARHGRPLNVPNLASLGLFEAGKGASGEEIPGRSPATDVVGAYAWASELSSGKDTPSGHWEIAGVPVLFDWGYFTDRDRHVPESRCSTGSWSAAGLPGVLGNCHASGTTIIAELGDEHVRTGKPIVYTSADSVFQIACPRGGFRARSGSTTLCDIARELVDEYNIGRVIARPFVGSEAANFVRTGNRRDLTVPPPEPTVLDKLVASGGDVISVGKIADIFAHQGITRKLKATGNAELIDTTLSALAEAPERSIVFTNLVDFDMLYGHRRDIEGYATALEYFDTRLPAVIDALDGDDLLFLCADHGCDPSWPGSDHTREHIPVLLYGDGVPPGNLGRRESFADIGQTIAAYFDLEPMGYGTALLS